MPIKYLFKKLLKGLLEILFLATCVYDILKKMKTAIKTGIVRAEAIYLSNDWLFTIETRIKRQVSCLPFYCPRRKQKNVATVLNGIAGKISRTPNHETKIIFSAICEEFYYQRCFLKLVLQKTRQNPWKLKVSVTELSL